MNTFRRMIPKESNSKINVNNVKDFYTKNDFSKGNDEAYVRVLMETVKIIQTILSRQLPPERYNGMINLSFIALYQNATTEEIQSSLVICILIQTFR